LFYNEVPKPRWFRYGGHLDDPEKTIYSFTHGDQADLNIFGYDTTTPEGREAFKKEWDTICELAPELISKDDILYPHEQPKDLPNEPHFRRVWQHYREHTFRMRFAYLVKEGIISQQEAKSFRNFTDLANVPTFNLYIYAKLGQLQHLKQDPGYQATLNVMEKLGLDKVKFDTKTSMPYEQQFWEQFDILMELNEEDMMKEVPAFVVDPSNKARVEALLAGRKMDAVGAEQSRLIPANV